MKKATFLNREQPLICAMVQDQTPEAMICTPKRAESSR